MVIAVDTVVCENCIKIREAVTSQIFAKISKQFNNSNLTVMRAIFIFVNIIFRRHVDLAIINHHGYWQKAVNKKKFYQEF